MIKFNFFFIFLAIYLFIFFLISEVNQYLVSKFFFNNQFKNLMSQDMLKQNQLRKKLFT